MRAVPVLVALAVGTAGAVLLVSGYAADERNAARGAASTGAASDCGAVDFDHYDARAEFEGMERTQTVRPCEDGGAPARLDMLAALYGRCDPAPDAGCAPPLQVQSWPACERNLALYEKYPGPEGVPAIEYRRTSLRGAPAAIFDGGRRIEVYTGDATIVVFAESARLARASAGRLSGVHDGRAVGAVEELPAPVDGALEGELAC
jgi:hypothetical protein